MNIERVKLASLVCLVAMAGLSLSAGGLGLPPRQPTKPYLNMPPKSDGAFPPLLSQTGAFADTAHLQPSPGLVPYDLNVSFWADGAWKLRWMALPDARIGFSATNEWKFPAGTVFVKHFELATNDTAPSQRRRLETRLLVRDAAGGVYGATYKWRADYSDADLLTTSSLENIVIRTASGTRTQSWFYPSSTDCLVCHTERAGGVLGPKTRQLNHKFAYPGGDEENELAAWSKLGLLDTNLTEEDAASCGSLAKPGELSRSLEDRARSYLDVNCGNCHRPGGTVAYFDARYTTPLDHQALIDGPILINEGIDRAHVISPKDIWRSILYMRAFSVEGYKMPPLAHEAVDTNGAALIRQWIESLPGKPVLAPPEFSQPAGNYAGAVDVKLSEIEPGAEIHFTIDGSIPGPNDPVYKTPLHLTESTTVRARAYKDGFTRSINAQQTFIIGQ